MLDLGIEASPQISGLKGLSGTFTSSVDLATNPFVSGLGAKPVIATTGSLNMREMNGFDLEPKLRSMFIAGADSVKPRK